MGWRAASSQIWGVEFEKRIEHQNRGTRNNSWICEFDVQERGVIWRNTCESHRVT